MQQAMPNRFKHVLFFFFLDNFNTNVKKTYMIHTHLYNNAYLFKILNYQVYVFRDNKVYLFKCNTNR